ncbi:hypothetical protein J2789_004500 [Variovorax paradoxus]|uniref:hypothetical protein n=1 Tax=Variovorax atrisoli TaxID=3394203 RepID=UPI0011A6B054|nr:hypothetical protein [Variovorax paradoxus]MDR6521810.1 hypothetical protein [Variovorax paradoxus]
MPEKVDELPLPMFAPQAFVGIPQAFVTHHGPDESFIRDIALALGNAVPSSQLHEALMQTSNIAHKVPRRLTPRISKYSATTKETHIAPPEFIGRTLLLVRRIDMSSVVASIERLQYGADGEHHEADKLMPKLALHLVPEPLNDVFHRVNRDLEIRQSSGSSPSLEDYVCGRQHLHRDADLVECLRVHARQFNERPGCQGVDEIEDDGEEDMQ